MQKTELKSPTTLNEALEILASDVNSKLIAGGTDLLPLFHKKQSIEQLKMQPISLAKELDKFSLVDISNLSELKGITKNNNYVEIGACTTHTELVTNAIIKQYFSSLIVAATQIGSPQIRNRGTIGGNIANASPAADTVPSLIVLKAEVDILSHHGNRKLFLKDFFHAPGVTILKTDELLTKIILPLPHPKLIQFYRRIAARKVHACAKASVAFCAMKQDNVLTDVHVAFGAVGPTVIFAHETAKILEGKNLTPSLINKAAEQAMLESNPIDDIRSTSEYRQAMIGELLQQELLNFIS